MKRHEALQDLSRDHHFALVRAQTLKRAGDAGGESAQDAARSLLAFWESELVEHFREEEEVLLPILARRLAVDEDRRTAKLVADHAWFRDAVVRLERRVEGGGELDGLVGEFGRRLEEHARFEEREFFPHVEDALTPDDLDDLQARSVAFRQRTRGAGAIGPRDRC